MTTIALDLLGGFELRAKDGTVLTLPTPKYRALLAFLAMPAGRSRPRDSLVALLWGELSHEQGRAALRQALWALRRSLAQRRPSILVLDGDSVALDAAAVSVDVSRFVHAAAQPDVESLACAAALYRGPLLAGLTAREAPFEDWLTAERERLAELALTALARLLAAQRASGRLNDAVQTALRLLALDPLQEVVHRALMETYAQLGRRSAALRQYQTCVTVLQRELGAEPEARTRTLYQSLLRHRGPGPAASPGPSSSSLGAPETPLIGRERELSELRQALADASTGRGGVVAVLGEAGIGKSRLVDELLAEAGRDARVLTGRAHESDRVLPLAPWADGLRRARIADDRELLATLPPPWRAEIARLLPELGHVGATTAHGAQDYVPLFEGIVGLVAALAARSPLVIVLEDLHWADDMSLRLVAFVARRVGRMPVLLVLTARVEELDTSLDRVLDALARDVAVHQVGLSPLAREETLRLVRALAGTRDEDALARLGDRIWTASEGHPFMVVEMVRAVAETTETDAPAAVALPQRVRRVIERRFQHLGAPAQQLVATAATVGRDFPYALLQRASGMTEDDAVGALEELVRRRVVHAVGERFEFTHDRLREVAYAQLLPPRRTLLHRRIAEALETLHGEEPAERHAALGVHYGAAEVWDRAAHHLHEAARFAHDRAAFREGIVLLERALAALARLPRTREAILLEIDVRLRLFRCLNPLGDPRADEEVARARALVVEQPDDAREAIILVEVAERRRLARDLGAAIDAARRALVLATTTGQARLVAQAHFQLGVAHVTRGAYDEGMAHLGSTVAGLAHAPQRDRLGYPYVTALCRLAWALADRGALPEAWRHADEAARIAEESQDAMTVAEACTAAGVLRLAEDRPAEAITPLERALAVARSREIHYMRAFSASWLALAHARLGRDREAAWLVDECERDRVWERVRLQWSRIVVRLAEARFLIGEPDRARALARDGLALARSIGEPAGEAEALALLGDIALRTAPDGTAPAHEHVTEAATLAARLGLRPLVARLRSLAVAAGAPR